ncbi:MAG: CHAT domain-containing protein [Bacteroidales bacterium]|nr:CHAT domain-containing protein [Bacteroidales bacterium]
MKILTLFFVFFFSTAFFLNAQNDQEDYKKAVEFFKSANDYKQKYDLENAKKYFIKAADLFKKHNYTGNYIQCRYSVADIYILKNKFKDAENILLEIEDISIEKYGENNQFLSNIYYGKGIVVAYEGKQDEAVDYYNKALKINEKSDKPNDFHKSNIYGGLGNAYSEKGDLDKALENYKKDIKIKKSIVGENHPILAVAYNNIANIYKAKGEYDYALEHIEKALNLSLNAYGKDNFETAKYYSSKGSIYMKKGQYDIALDFFKTALNINKAIFGEKHKSVADNLSDIGILYNKQAEYDKALIYYKDAYDIQIDLFGEDHPDIAGICNNIGDILEKQGKHESSLKYYEKAVAVKIKYFGSNHPELAVYYNNMGINYYNRKNYNSSMMYYLKAVSILENNYGSKFPRLVKIYANIGSICLKENNFNKSLYYYQKSLAANIKDFNPDSTDYYSNPFIRNYFDINNLLISLNGKADALYRLFISEPDNTENLKLSYENYILCDSAIIIARKKIVKKTDKILLGNRSRLIYDNAVTVTIELSEISSNEKQRNDYYKKAFYFAENNKAVVLSEAVNAAEAKYFINLPNDILEQEKSLKTAIAGFEKDLSEITDENKIKIFEENLFVLNDELRKLNNLIESKYPKYHELKYKPAEFSIKDIQNKIDNKTVVRSYFLGQDNIIIFTIKKDSYDVSFSEKPEDFEKKVNEFNKNITSGYETDFKLYMKSGQYFYNLFFPKKLPEDIEKLIIIPDGMIGLIPFETLLTESYNGDVTKFKEYPFLIKKCQINYAYSAGLLLKSLKIESRKNDSRKAWFGIAPVFENLPENFSRSISGIDATALLGTKTEINKIEQLFKQKGFLTNSLVDASATKSDFKNSDLKNYKYIHIATHGHVNILEPKLSGILMYIVYGDKNDMLYSGEIYNLELDADLAVLSACETGLGKISKSEGIIGLSRALLFAGADNIIVSLWKVSDESTSNLMVDFYLNLLENEADRAFALHKAKLKMIGEGGTFAHPFFWSPFVLIGK